MNTLAAVQNVSIPGEATSADPTGNPIFRLRRSFARRVLPDSPRSWRRGGGRHDRSASRTKRVLSYFRFRQA